MSRVGKKPILFPKNVAVEVKDGVVFVKGQKGELSENIPPLIDVRVSDNSDNIVYVQRKNESKLACSLHGLIRSIIQNMVIGVTKGFEKKLEIVGVGYRASLNGKNLDLSLGFSHPVAVSPPDGVDFVLESPQKIIVRGIDKQLVGQTAADIKKLRKPEPYKGKGIRFSGEHILRKAGKTAS